MPAVKPWLDPFSGCDLQGWGHHTKSLAMGLSFKGLFSFLLLWGVQSLTSVNVSEDSLLLCHLPPINPGTLFLTAIKHTPVNLHPHLLMTGGLTAIWHNQYMCRLPASSISNHASKSSTCRFSHSVKFSDQIKWLPQTLVGVSWCMYGFQCVPGYVISCNHKKTAMPLRHV